MNDHLCIAQFQKKSIPPDGRSSEIPRGRGVLKVKILEQSMKLNWNFLGGGWCKTKNLHGGSMDIFWNCIFPWDALNCLK